MRIPRHIGIIPDGNRRWAVKNAMEKHQGYQYGLEPGLQVLHLAQDYGIEEITYYGFTTDNCKRPPQQLEAFSQACVQAVQLISSEPVSLLVVGNDRTDAFPQELKKYTVRQDILGGGIKVNFLVNYGWEWDFSQMHTSTANRQIIQQEIMSHDISRMDMVIRWGGMRRLSGFLPVQSVYADFYTVENLWPNFQPQDFHDALQWYQHQDVTLGG